MSQDNQQARPEEEVGGYGTPTAEQEMGGAPTLGHLSEEDQDSAGEPGAGRFGGTGGQYHAETDTNDPGFEPGKPPVPRDAETPNDDEESFDAG